MKLEEAMKIIKEYEVNFGYYIHFERSNPVLMGEKHEMAGDFFPSIDELGIETKEEAWDIAKRFARATRGKYFNIYVCKCGSDSCSVNKEQILNKA